MVVDHGLSKETHAKSSGGEFYGAFLPISVQLMVRIWLATPSALLLLTRGMSGTKINGSRKI
jgi:hypothetical protein